ncbi:DUF2280 domain-containing protein [Paraburkholderia megapolitana]|uniref:DUF2280 domain-containing protein n=1 Tax=Paraburkholderia megapolitana TaxID=420953 RepID=UPI0038BD4859
MKPFPPKVRRTIVTALATGHTPSEAARVVFEEHGVQVSRQVCARHDPRRISGRNLSVDLKDLFYNLHEQFVEQIEQIGLAHRADRLVRLQSLYEAAETTKDFRTMLRVVDLARREMTDLYPDPNDGDDDA